jgi:hypothetical protein
MTHIGNLYSIDGPLEESIARDLVHFQQKHGIAPTIIKLHPDNLKQIKRQGFIAVLGAGPELYGARYEPDPTQGKASYMIVRREQE